MKKINTNKKGFTIIEVVLVLAIAGLIFMMVFIALPALQRSQRDTQRSNDIARVQTAINNYQANNRGAIPTGTDYVLGHTEQSSGSYDSDGVKGWLYFYDSYLMVNAGGSQDSFADPDGEPYSLWAVDCQSSNKNGGGLAAQDQGTPCANPNAQKHNVTFDDQAAGTLEGEAIESSALNASITYSNGIKQRGHTITIVKHAICDGETAIYSIGSRKVAILYKKEGGGIFCLNN